MQNYEDREGITQWNKVLNYIGHGFAIIFIIEAILKIIALGFVFEKHTYLRDAWNVIDFIIVISASLELIAYYSKFGGSINIKALRNLRILRPLKSINQIPSMRRLVATLLYSMPELLNVTIFLFFILLVYGIVGLQLYQGRYYNKCRLTEQPINGQWDYIIEGENYRICSKENLGKYHCPSEYYCGNPYEYDYPLENDYVYNNPNLLYGVPTFDNIFKSILGVFIIIAKDQCSLIMLMNSSTGFVAAIFCCSIILLGAFFLMNLILAVITQAFNNIQAKEQQFEEKKMIKKMDKASKKNKESTPKGKKVVHSSPKESDQEREKKRLAEISFSKPPSVVENPNPLSSLIKIPIQIKSSEMSINKEQQDTRIIESIQVPGINEVQQERNKQYLGDSDKEEEDSEQVQKARKMKFQMQNKLKNLFSNAMKPKEEEKNNQEEEKKEPSSNMASMLFKPGAGKKPENQQQQLLFKAMSKMYTKALQIEDGGQQKLAFQEIKTKNNFLLFKLKQAINNKVQEAKKKYYGFENEGSVVDYVQSNIDKRFKTKSTLIQDITKAEDKNQEEEKKFELVLQIQKDLREEYLKKQIMGKIFNHLNDTLLKSKEIQDLVKAADQMVDDDLLEIRAQKRKVYEICLRICSHSAFSIFIILCIIGNTVALSFDRFGLDQQMITVIDSINTTFYAIFFIEMVVKLLGLGKDFYFKDPFNTFDFVIVIISTVDVVLTQSKLLELEGSEAIQALRAFRLLRVFKLAQRWKNFQRLLTTIFHTLKDISTFSVLLFLFIFTYSLLGMEWFAYKAKFNDNNEIDLENGTYVDQNFNTFYQAFLTVFNLLTSDGWSNIYFLHYRAAGAALSTLYFISLMLVGKYILLMLFLAILVENFDQDSFSQAQEYIQEKKAKDQKKKQKKARFQIRFRVEPSVSNNEINDQQGLQIKVNKSLFLFEENSPFRQFFYKIVTSKYYEIAILILIVLASIHLVIDNPLNDPNGKKSEILFYADVAFASIFSLEVVFNIIAYGVICNGKKSYMRSIYNVLDFGIILLSVNLQFNLKYLGIICFSTRGAIIGVQSSKDVQDSEAHKRVNFFKGLYYYCEYSNSSTLTGFEDQILVDKWDCLNYGADWLKHPSTFDNVIVSYKGNNYLLTLIAIITLSQAFSWQKLMFWAMDARGIDLVQAKNVNAYRSVFFVVFIIVGSYFITNLFVGVVISTYNREKEKLGKNFLLTEDQKKWLNTKLLVIQAKPKLFLKEPQNKYRKFFYFICRHRFFDGFIMICIFANSLVLAMEYPGQSQIYEDILEYLNIIFTVIFTLEVIAKLIAYDYRYFKDGWNIFDFIIVIGSIFGLFLRFLIKYNGHGATTAIRAFRIARIFKLFKKQKQLQVILETFIITLPALTNVGGLLMLLTYMFAVLGINQWAHIKLNGPLNEIINFKSITNSFLAIIQLSTGDSFYELMNALSVKKDVNFDCINKATYQDYKEAGYETVGCGKELETFLILFAFICCVMLIFLNLFIAIILQAYSDTTNGSQQMFNSDMRDNFRDSWSYFDQDATGFMEIADFPNFMNLLNPPLGWAPHYRDNVEKQLEFIKLLEFQTYNNFQHYYFLDILEKLAMFQVVSNELKIYINNKVTKKDANGGESNNVGLGLNFFTQIRQKFSQAEENQSYIKEKEKETSAKLQKRRPSFQDASNEENKTEAYRKIESQLFLSQNSLSPVLAQNFQSTKNKLFSVDLKKNLQKIDSFDSDKKDWEEKISDFESSPTKHEKSRASNTLTLRDSLTTTDHVQKISFPKVGCDRNIDKIIEEEIQATSQNSELAVEEFQEFQEISKESSKSKDSSTSKQSEDSKEKEDQEQNIDQIQQMINEEIEFQ